MEKELFDTIYNSLFDHYFECKSKLSHIHSKKDFENMILSDLLELKEWANTALANMTTIVMVDLYHIIGMGNLTVVQSSRLTSLIHKYLNYRTILKTITSHFNSFEDIPEVPTSSKYVLQKLAKGVELKNGNGEVFEETASLIDLAKKKKKELPKNCPFTLDHNTVYLDDAQKKEFFENFNKLGCGTAGKFENFNKKLNSRSSYLGIKWEAYKEGIWVGKITTSKIYQKLREWFESGKEEVQQQ